jgi:acetyltransferase-like isoleucine patch superfamily enzyme
MRKGSTSNATMLKVEDFVKKYEFPIHLFVFYDVILCRWSILFSTWKAKLILSLLGCEYGKNLHVDGQVVIRADKKRGCIRIGDNVKLKSRFLGNLSGMTNPTVLRCLDQGHISIGNNSGCSSTIFSSRSSIQVGENVNIGSNVRIFDHDFHPVDYLERRKVAGELQSSPIVIGNDVFIGTQAIILKGAHIGARSIIGAGAVVGIKSIPPDSLVVGNPAKVIKSLTTADHLALFGMDDETSDDHC